MERLLEVADGESGGARAGDKFGGELGELAMTLGGRGLDLPVGDEGARALLGIQNSAQFHLAISPRDGIGIDGQIDGDAAHCGELVAGLQRSGSHRRLHLVDQLPVDRHARVGIEAEGELGRCGLWLLLHRNQCTSQLVH